MTREHPEPDPHDPRIPRPATDGRHRPGPEALPLWNESLWFAMYDPAEELGVVVRWGLHPRLGSGSSNYYLGILHRGETVLVATHQSMPMPPDDPDRIALANGLTLQWREPLRSFRLTYDDGGAGFDLTFTGMSPPYLYDSWQN